MYSSACSCCIPASSPEPKPGTVGARVASDLITTRPAVNSPALVACAKPRLPIETVAKWGKEVTPSQLTCSLVLQIL